MILVSSYLWVCFAHPAQCPEGRMAAQDHWPGVEWLLLSSVETQSKNIWINFNVIFFFHYSSYVCHCKIRKFDQLWVCIVNPGTAQIKRTIISTWWALWLVHCYADPIRGRLLELKLGWYPRVQVGIRKKLTNHVRVRVAFDNDVSTRMCSLESSTRATTLSGLGWVQTELCGPVQSKL